MAGSASKEQIGIRRLKDSLSESVTSVREGEVIIVTDRGEPVARMGLKRQRPLARIWSMVGKAVRLMDTVPSQK